MKAPEGLCVLLAMTSELGCTQYQPSGLQSALQEHMEALLCRSKSFRVTLENALLWPPFTKEN